MNYPNVSDAVVSHLISQGEANWTSKVIEYNAAETYIIVTAYNGDTIVSKKIIADDGASTVIARTTRISKIK